MEHHQVNTKHDQSKPTYVKVNVRYDESPFVALTVNINPYNCEKNIHKFISQLCQVLNHKYDSSLILLLEPDHIIFDVTTVEENDQLRIVSRSKLSQIMCKQEELRRKGIYLKILFSNDPIEAKMTPLDLMKGSSACQKLGEEFTSKPTSAVDALKKERLEEEGKDQCSGEVQKQNYYSDSFKKMKIFQ